MVFIPVKRDELIKGLIDGRGDIAAAGLAITANREKLTDFSDPIVTNVDEILVTGPESPATTPAPAASRGYASSRPSAATIPMSGSAMSR